MAGPTYATFGNTVYSRGFDFTFGPGVQPSVCQLYTIPGLTADPPPVATLTITTNGGQTLTFRNCLLEEPKMQSGMGGKLVTLPIKDRRWMWQPPMGPIYGHFNKPEANGSYTRETTPQQLAEMLLVSLGESQYDVTRLPNTTRPEKRWDGAFAAIELDTLCAEHSCVVVLNPFNDRAEIWPIGTGAGLPPGGALGRTASPVRPAQPSRIKVEAAETLFQATFPTEPVGLDTDGNWRHIDQLSYRPSFGWPFPVSGYPFFNPDTDIYLSGGKTLKIRDLAEGTVYRYYRIKGINDWVNGCAPPLLSGTFQFPVNFKDLRFFNELAEEQIQTGAGPQNGGLVPMESRVYARWERYDHKATPAGPTLYPDGFSFDTENWVVGFGEPIFLFSGGGVIPADVKFECSFFAGATGIFSRRGIIVDTNNPPATTPIRLIQRPEIQARVIYRFDANGHQTTSSDNLADVDTRLQYWADAAQREYGLQPGGTVTYPSLVLVAPDGLTQQVTWSGGGKRETVTTVSQAQRHNRFIQPLDQHREKLAAKKTSDLMLQLQTGQLLRALGGGV